MLSLDVPKSLGLGGVRSNGCALVGTVITSILQFHRDFVLPEAI